MSNYINNLKFSHKITAFFALVIVIICLVTTYQFKTSTEVIKEARVRNIETYVYQLNKAISAQFFERYGDVQAFTRNEVFLSKNKNHMVQTLNDYANLYGIYDLIIYVDTNGNLISVNDQKPDKSKIDTTKLYTMNFKNEQWFVDSIQESYSKDMAKGFNGTVFVPFIKDTLVSEIYSASIETSLFAAPVKNREGRIIGVICNRANSKWFIDELANLKAELARENWAQASLKILDDKNSPITSMNIGNGKVLDENSESVITQTVQIQENKFLNETKWFGSLSIPEYVLFQDVIKSERQFYSVLSILFILALIATYFISNRISLELEKISNTIAKMSEFTAHMTQEFSKSSEGLSQNSVKQASSIQQSVAALAEVTSMISMSSEKIKYSNDITKNVQIKATVGKQIMEKVIHSMEDIRDTNLELQEINRIMAKISQKTELINDIVFKTQLLSFNASIEAARAGQNGRGFSVVAEEVSHLAELSGKASKEIENLLNESKRKVESSLVSIQAKITDGSNITSEANHTFNEITESIESITQQLSAVNESTNQQNISVSQANQAMRELETSADSNSTTANEFSRRFVELKNKTQDLNSATLNLKKIVNG